MPRYGADVSSNNPHPINWAALYAYLHGLGGDTPFVIVKVTQGAGYVNPDAKADIAAARAAGFVVGGYMMDQGNATVATEEALFLANSQGVPEFDDDELPEGDSTGAYIAHLRPLAANGKPQYLNQSEEDAGYPAGGGLWEANYNGKPGVTHKPGVLIHQYTSTGTAPGCAGLFDFNLWTGTETQFDQFFHLTTTTTAPVPTKEQAMAALNRPIVDDADHIVGGQVTGYWLVGQDGGLFAFGSAEQLHLPATVALTPGDLIVSMKVSPTGNGLRLVGSNGGVYCLGDAAFFGSIPGDNIGPSSQPLEA